MNDAEAREEEVTALQAIFGDDMRVTSPDSRAFEIDVLVGGRSNRKLTIRVRTPEKYPSAACPELYVASPEQWLNRQHLKVLADALVAMFVPGDVVVFRWVEWLGDNESVSSVIGMDALTVGTPSPSQSPSPSHQKSAQLALPPPPAIVHGAAVTDRKSKFIAHAAIVHNKAEVDAMVASLKEDKKIACATHNIVAYRIALSDGRIDTQRDDDGETGAGDKLLFLLDQRRETEACVVVTRWFGGIHLGPDRFKHISNTARDVLDSSELQKLRTRK